MSSSTNTFLVTKYFQRYSYQYCDSYQSWINLSAVQVLWISKSWCSASLLLA